MVNLVVVVRLFYVDLEMLGGGSVLQLITYKQSKKIVRGLK